MDCWHCGSRLVWQNDFSYEDYGIDSDKEGIITVLMCSNEECKAYIEVYKDI